MCDFIHTRLKNKFMLLDVKIVVTSGGVMMGKWNSDNVLLLDLGPGYTGVFSL